MKFLYIREENSRLSAHIEQLLTERAEAVETYVLPAYVCAASFNILQEEDREALAKRLVQKDYDLVFSMGYFHEVALFCRMTGMVYVSWVVELPNPDLWRQGIESETNCIFVADSWWASWLSERGCEQCFYLPAAAYACEKRLEFAQYETGCITRYPAMPENSPFYRLLMVSLRCKGYLDGLVHTQRVCRNREIVSASLTSQVLTEWKRTERIRAPKDILLSEEELYTWLGILPQVMRQEQELLFRDFPVDIAVCNGQQMTEKTDYAVYPYPDEPAEVIARTGINIHLPNRYYIHGTDPLAFEILAQGGFMMAPEQADMKELFRDEKDYISFDGGYELREKLKDWRDRYEERYDIAESGYERVRQEHTYAHRIDTLMKVL